ncbi:MAG: glycosyltransferase family 39 protein [Candidatus Levyibacteriota bacterium]
MFLLKKYKVQILLWLGILGSYFLSRLTNIMSLPLFTDEAIYTRWAQIAKQDASWRFISLTDGKQPMLTWVAMILMRFFHDPLFATRMASVLAGFSSVIGIFFLSRELFKNKWIGFLSSALFVVFPFTLVYDRMALQESLVCAFLIWALYVQILLVRRLQSFMPFVAGLVVGGGVLTKTTNFWSIYFMPFLLLLFDWKKDDRWGRLLRFVFFAGITTVLAYMYYSILRLSPYFGIIAEKNYTFYYSLHDWLQHPITFFLGNLHGMLSWLITYVNWLGLLLALVSFFVYRKFWKEKLLLVLWFVVPFLIFALIGKVLYPRYIIYMTIFLIPLIAVSLYEAFHITLGPKNLFGFVFIVLLFSSYLFVDRFVLFDFAHAPIPGSDLNQYINDWPAGGGVKEMVSFLSDQSKKGKLYVASEGTFGSVPTLAIEIYLDSDKNIGKRGIWPLPKVFPNDLLEKAKTMPVYYVFNQTQTPPSNFPLKFIAKWQKGISSIYMSIYQVTL